jgi:hypothetical protein
VINIWATWCPPCRREMPVLQQAQSDYPHVTFLFVNQGETGKRQHLPRHHRPEPDPRAVRRHRPAGPAVGSMALPTTLFYDADGRLVGSHLGELSRASLRHALEPFDRASAPPLPHKETDMRLTALLPLSLALLAAPPCRPKNCPRRFSNCKPRAP